MTSPRGSGLNRRTLKKIRYYPTPAEVTRAILQGKGWPYHNDVERYLARDRALVSVTYLAALRISEALSLRREQFIVRESEDYVEVRGIPLAKSIINRRKGTQRKDLYREARLPLSGERAELTGLLTEYIETVEEDARLFPIGIARAWQLVTSLVPWTCHHLRAFGEDYLYSVWDKDILAVSDYVKVNPGILSAYIRKRYTRYRSA